MHSAATWAQETTGTEVADKLKDKIAGKNVLITGVSPKSLGESTALALARHNPARLVLASRTVAKLRQVAAEVNRLDSEVKIDLVELDLSSQQAIRRAAVQIEGLIGHLDILVNNAGVVTSGRQETAEGIELQFGTNHIGHFLLTSLLTPLLLAAAARSQDPGATRVVNLSSLGYQLSPLRFHDYSFEGKPVPPEEEPSKGIPSRMKPDLAAGRQYYTFTAYGQSKTANILHAVALNRRLGDQGIKAFAVHPGSIWTDLSRNLSPDDLSLIEGTSGFWKDTDQGSATTIAAAFDPNIGDASDKVLLSDCHLVDCLQYATDPTIAERLWELSEKLTVRSVKL